ncbi:MAG: transcriptional regulator [Thermoguttaceae bacterium]|nr:transcriptional regulator [Thermoguttaceae bacterium]
MATPSSEKKIVEKNNLSSLSELGALIEELPPELKPRFEKAFRRAVSGMQHRQNVLTFVKNSISQLRLNMRYLIFDLEATRQERDEYRRRLEDLF